MGSPLASRQFIFWQRKGAVTQAVLPAWQRIVLPYTSTYLATITELVTICSNVPPHLCLSRPSNIIFQSKDSVPLFSQLWGLCNTQLPTHTHTFLLPPHAHKYCDIDLEGVACLFAGNVFDPRGWSPSPQQLCVHFTQNFKKRKSRYIHNKSRADASR